MNNFECWRISWQAKLASCQLRQQESGDTPFPPLWNGHPLAVFFHKGQAIPTDCQPQSWKFCGISWQEVCQGCQLQIKLKILGNQLPDFLTRLSGSNEAKNSRKLVVKLSKWLSKRLSDGCQMVANDNCLTTSEAKTWLSSWQLIHGFRVLSEWLAARI